MKHLSIPARIIIGNFAFVNLIGFLWFFDANPVLTSIACLYMALLEITFALLPSSIFRRHAKLIICLTVVAFVLYSVITITDLFSMPWLSLGAIIMRVFELSIIIPFVIYNTRTDNMAVIP